MSNYVTQYDLKKVSGIDTFQFPKKDNLVISKSDDHKLDIEKLDKVQCKFKQFKK